MTGNVYLGGPESGPITGPPYTMYVVAESPRYGVSVRLKGTVVPNETTGRVTTIFTENPEQPFTNLTLHFKGGALAPIANPLTCGTATTATSFVPFANPLTTQSPASAFAVTGCPSPLPFAWAQSTSTLPTMGGATTTFTFTLVRPDGQQYLEKTSVTLPPGLVGKIPAVAQCAEAQANAGTCPTASKIGTVSRMPARAPPYPFSGTVYLTGPYQGAPVRAVDRGAGGGRAVQPRHGRHARDDQSQPEHRASGGEHSQAADDRRAAPDPAEDVDRRDHRPNFMLNPTNCGVLRTESTLTSTLGAIQNVSTPFQVSNCSALGVQAVVHLGEHRQDVESQRREP